MMSDKKIENSSARAVVEIEITADESKFKEKVRNESEGRNREIEREVENVISTEISPLKEKENSGS